MQEWLHNFLKAAIVNMPLCDVANKMMYYESMAL